MHYLLQQRDEHYSCTSLTALALGLAVSVMLYTILRATTEPVLAPAQFACKVHNELPAAAKEVAFIPGPYLAVKPSQEAPSCRSPHAWQQRLCLRTADEGLAGGARRAVGTAMLLAVLLMPLQL
jgi:hypothetical protein